MLLIVLKSENEILQRSETDFGRRRTWVTVLLARERCNGDEQRHMGHKGHSGSENRFRLESMEARILLSADALAVAFDPPQEPDPLEPLAVLEVSLDDQTVDETGSAGTEGVGYDPAANLDDLFGGLVVEEVTPPESESDLLDEFSLTTLSSPATDVLDTVFEGSGVTESNGNNEDSDAVATLSSGWTDDPEWSLNDVAELTADPCAAESPVDCATYTELSVTTLTAPHSPPTGAELSSDTELLGTIAPHDPESADASSGADATSAPVVSTSGRRALSRVPLDTDGADLVITTTETAASGSVHESLTFTFTVTNRGNAATTADTWWDAVILTNSTSYSPGDGFAQMAQVEHTGVLGPGESYTGTVTLSVEPWNYEWILDGTGWQVFFVTDNPWNNGTGDVVETDDTNNVTTTGVPVTYTQAAIDLDVTAVTPPASVEIGAPAQMSVTVRNTGTDPATGVDGDIWATVFVSTDSTFDQYGDTNLGWCRVSGLATLAPDSATKSGTLTFSAGNSVAPGDYYLFVRVNLGQDEWDREKGQPEENTSNNTLATTSPVTFVAPTMDLEISDVSVTPASQTTGYPVELTWTVTNTGSGNAGLDYWNDHVFLSTDNTFSDDDVVVTWKVHEGGLAAGAHYDVTTTVDLPYSEGAFLIFYADRYNNQPEAGDDTNNRLSIPIAVTYAVPDLQVTTAEVAPSSTSTGFPVTLSWTVTNVDADDAVEDSWTDYVYLSSDETYSNDDVLVTSVVHTGGLTGNDQYDVTSEVNLPQTEGSFLLFITDKNNNQPEADDDNNLVSVPVQLTVARADLTVSDTSVSPTSVNSGEYVDVSWTVANIQDGAYAVGGWSDAVYFSADNVFDVGEDTFLGSFYRSGNDLAYGASYTVTKRLQIPFKNGAFLFIVADRNGEQPETNEDNNTASVPITVTYIPPDLVILDDATVTGTVAPGQYVTVDWTGKNLGPGTIGNQYFSDQLYLSDDDMYDASDYSLGFGGQVIPGH